MKTTKNSQTNATNLIDSIHHRVFAEQRQALLDLLRPALRRALRGTSLDSGVHTGNVAVDDVIEAVLTAMNAVPREEFVPSVLLRRAYENVSLPIGNGQTISQPLTVAFMTVLLNVRRGSRILEIGTGSGYQAAVLAQMGAEVCTIERVPALYQTAHATFERLHVPVSMRLADGTVGWQNATEQSEQLFDGIIVTAGAPDVPPALLQQITIGRRLVIPVGSAEQQTLHCITRMGADSYETLRWNNFSFVPLIGKEGWYEQ